MNLVSRYCFALSMTASAAALGAGVANDIRIADPYVRAFPPGARATAAFMTLKNDGNVNASLVKADSAAAKSVELHSHTDNNGVMEMRQVPAIEIKARQQTALKPGGFHIMLIDPAPGLKEGDKVGFLLRFADGSSKPIEATVRRPEAGHGHAP